MTTQTDVRCQSVGQFIDGMGWVEFGPDCYGGIYHTTSCTNVILDGPNDPIGPTGLGGPTGGLGGGWNFGDGNDSDNPHPHGICIGETSFDDVGERGRYLNYRDFNYNFLQRSTGVMHNVRWENFYIQVSNLFSNRYNARKIYWIFRNAIAGTEAALTVRYPQTSPPKEVIKALFKSQVLAQLGATYGSNSSYSINTIPGGCAGVPEQTASWNCVVP